MRKEHIHEGFIIIHNQAVDLLAECYTLSHSVIGKSALIIASHPSLFSAELANYIDSFDCATVDRICHEDPKTRLPHFGRFPF